MTRLAFTEEEQQALHKERFEHPHPRVQQRMEALWLKSQGLPHHQIAQLCAISANTLRSYLTLYHTGAYSTDSCHLVHRKVATQST